MDMKPKTCKSNKNEYGIVRNLSTMNHFLIMVLCKKVNLITLHYLMGCKLLVTVYLSTFECLCIPSLGCLNHKCKVFIMLQLGLLIERDGPLVEVKFNFCIIIPHYYNNKFALHMHTSIIFALILNTFNIAIHQNTVFMVISYKQNLHVKIHCKKLQKQY
jgi:hypothetical protein